MSQRQSGALVEVTPAMIEAGAHALITLNISDLMAGDVTPQEASARVYEAMERARLRVPG